MLSTKYMLSQMLVNPSPITRQLFVLHRSTTGCNSAKTFGSCTSGGLRPRVKNNLGEVMFG